MLNTSFGAPSGGQLNENVTRPQLIDHYSRIAVNAFCSDAVLLCSLCVDVRLGNNTAAPTIISLIQLIPDRLPA